MRRVPLVPFLVDVVSRADVAAPYAWSAVATGATFFGVGALKGRLVGAASWRSGLETLAVGGGAAGVAYAVGVLLGGLA